MKKTVLEFIRRGLISGGFGPIVLAVLYLILQKHAGLENLAVHQVCIGVFSIYGLAFIAGGMNVIYQIERLPLMVAILIHGGILYFSYLAAYLLNDWLEWGKMPVLVFTVIFVVGYLLIWAIIYFVIRSKTAKVNDMLKMQREKRG